QRAALARIAGFHDHRCLRIYVRRIRDAPLVLPRTIRIRHDHPSGPSHSSAIANRDPLSLERRGASAPLVAALPSDRWDGGVALPGRPSRRLFLLFPPPSPGTPCPDTPPAVALPSEDVGYASHSPRARQCEFWCHHITVGPHFSDALFASQSMECGQGIDCFPSIGSVSAIGFLKSRMRLAQQRLGLIELLQLGEHLTECRSRLRNCPMIGAAAPS